MLALQHAFGRDVEIIDDDVPYGDDPVQTMLGLIEKHGGDVVAIEVVAPILVIAKLTQAKRELSGIKILRAEFARGVDGRALVVSKSTAGRDVFGFGCYEVLERVVVESTPLLPNGPSRA